MRRVDPDHIPGIDLAQTGVEHAREQYERALAYRAIAVRKARVNGFTIYAIAKQLGVTQGAVRKMLDL